MGITGAMKTAHLAEAFGPDCEIHAAGPAQRHCMAAMRNSNWYELSLVVAKSSWHPIGQRKGSLFTWITNSYSTGHVRLRSASVREQPEVAFQLLSDPRDMVRMGAVARGRVAGGGITCTPHSGPVNTSRRRMRPGRAGGVADGFAGPAARAGAPPSPQAAASRH